jgi:hypothetical protein
MSPSNRLLRSPLLVSFCILTLGACASSPEVRVDAVEGALPDCRTFAWNPVPSGDAASLVEQRIRTAAMQALHDKGYTEVNDKADCRIAYQLSSQQIEPSKPRVGVGMGGGSGGLGGGIGISLPIGKGKAERGTFTLDIIDSAKNAQVWSGSVDAAFDSAEISVKEANELVRGVLAKYPDRK